MKIKIYALAVASFGLQVLTWWFMHRALITDPGAGSWIWASVIAAFAVSVTTFFLLVNSSRMLSNLLIVASAAAYLVISPKNIYVWLGGLIFGLFAIWYQERLASEKKSRVDFAVTPVMSSSVGILLYGILLLLGLNIYYNVAADFRNNPDKFYNKLGQQATKSVPYFSKFLLPDNVDLNQSLESYLVAQNLKENPQYQQAGPFEREILLGEAKQAFQNQFQVTADSSDTLAEIMAQVAISKIRQVVEPFGNYLPLIFSILVTGLLYTFSFLMRWLIIIISWALFKVLLMFKFFRLEKIQVEVEKLAI